MTERPGLPTRLAGAFLAAVVVVCAALIVIALTINVVERLLP